MTPMVKLLAGDVQLSSMDTTCCLGDTAIVQVVISARASRIFVADKGNLRVSIVDVDSGQGECLLIGSTPTSIVVDHDGAAIVTDYSKGRVHWWRGDGVSRIVAGSENQPLENPKCIFIDNCGSIYVSEAGHHRVTRWFPGADHGEIVAGGRGCGSDLNMLSSPAGIVVDDEGAVYVADSGSGRVTCWPRGAQTGEEVASGLAHPWGLCLDSEGALYVSDVTNHRITRWTRGAKQGEVVVGKHGCGQSNYQLAGPTGIFLDEQGTLYVAENHNHRVSRWAPGEQACTVVAGTGGRGSAPDQLDHPVDVFVN